MTKPTPKTCLSCGCSVAPDAPGPQCPECVSRTIEKVQPWFPALELVDFLGAGGMGRVYKARQPRLDRFVALKVLTPPSGHHEDFALRFEREAQVMARLDHPNIVTIHDFGEVDRSGVGLENLFYLVMEHVDGTDLNALVRSGALDTGRAFALFAQICEALQFAHEAGITHRDIKPANLLVDGKGRVKIADFGLAKLLCGDETLAMDLTMTGAAMGTPHYMAPEQWEGSGAIDHRADIYALGVVLYEMLTGSRPVGAFPSASKVLRIDPRIDAVVSKAMEGAPERRFQSASEVREAIRAIEAPPRRVRRRAFVAGVVIALGTALGLAAKTWSSWRPTMGGDPERAATVETSSVSPVSTGPAAAEPSSATKETPFANRLGMKFVPVPGTEVLFCIHETRYRDYAAYAEENPDVQSAWKNQSQDGFTVADRNEDHPVWRVSWEDAQGFCRWLGRKEGRAYRLPTDREWSFAVGIGEREEQIPGDTPQALSGKVRGEFPWGTQWPPPPGTGNFFNDLSRRKLAPGPGISYLEGYDDGFPLTAPVMSFPPNRLGIHDLDGNLIEWVEDWFSDQKDRKTLRGATIDRAMAQSSIRMHHRPMENHFYCGFRVVVEIAAPSPVPDEDDGR